MADERDAVWSPLALAHVIVEWLYLTHVSMEEKVAALDIAKRVMLCPRRLLLNVSEVPSLSSDAPSLSQSNRGTDHRAETQDVDSCQSHRN